MWFRRLFKRTESSPEAQRQAQSLNQGISYFYLIIALQVLFVFTMVGAIMFIGKVLATPTWVFFATLLGAVAGCIYIYRKACEKFHRLRESIQRVNLSDRNYEISFMGGVLTMRVEQNSRQLLEAPESPVLESDPVDRPVVR